MVLSEKIIAGFAGAAVYAVLHYLLKIKIKENKKNKQEDITTTIFAGAILWGLMMLYIIVKMWFELLY